MPVTNVIRRAVTQQASASLCSAFQSRTRPAPILSQIRASSTLKPPNLKPNLNSKANNKTSRIKATINSRLSKASTSIEKAARELHKRYGHKDYPFEKCVAVFKVFAAIPVVYIGLRLFVKFYVWWLRINGVTNEEELNKVYEYMVLTVPYR